MGQLIVNPENKIKKLFIDWNHVTPEFLKIVPSSPALEFLTLRCCNLSTPFIPTLSGFAYRLLVRCDQDFEVSRLVRQSPVEGGLESGRQDVIV